MKTLRWWMVSCFCLQLCNGANSPEFKSAVYIINNEANAPVLLSKLIKLVNKNANIATEKDSKKNTLLHYSKARGFPSVSDYLIRKGADVQAKNAEHQTPQEFAASFSLEKKEKSKKQRKYEAKHRAKNKLLKESQILDESDMSLLDEIDLNEKK